MDEILDKLASLLADAVGLNYATVPEDECRQLYLYQVDEAFADPIAAAALRPTGGPAPTSYTPVTEHTAQVYILGATQADALALGWSIYQACRDDDNLPLRNVSVVGWAGRFLRIDPGSPPYPIGVNESGRAEVVFNIAYEVALAKE